MNVFYVYWAGFFLAECVALWLDASVSTKILILVGMVVSQGFAGVYRRNWP